MIRGQLMDTTAYLAYFQDRATARLRRVLARCSEDARLRAAMHYSVMAGGKRLRPVLAYSAAEALGTDPGSADIPACALELMHTYSLIHDDLPAMDDDRLRRGQPTCHVRFDEATAILAGDALQSLAFGLLADSGDLKVGNGTRLRMLSVLAEAAGPKGMVAGQSMDIGAAGRQLTLAQLQAMHERKTGALIRASVLLGAMSTNIATQADLAALRTFASCLGLAFQVHDDVLDVTGDTGRLGKQPGRDALLAKPTYVSLLGLEAARDHCRRLLEEGRDALTPFGDRARGLRALAAYIVQRDS